jgi:lactoylglutathione lyase
VTTAAAVSIAGLFETHLTVADLDRSIRFYREIVGLRLAMHDADAGVAFFWVGDAGGAMLGLWATSAPIGMSLHVAFTTSLEEILQAAERLRELGVSPLSFDGRDAAEPSVIGWMPAAAVFFRDPDGHLLEYLTMLDEAPDPDGRVVSWSAWSGRSHGEAREPTRARARTR